MNRYFEDLSIGDTFAARGRTVTECDITMFSGISGMWHPLHNDEVWATTEGPYGGRIAQGYLTLAIAAQLEVTLVGSGDKVLALYGVDRIRFPKPVFIGDTLHLVAEVADLVERDDGCGVVAVHHEVRNQRDETVAVLDKRVLHRCRPSGYVLEDASGGEVAASGV
jgi:acyl dehydratase